MSMLIRILVMVLVVAAGTMSSGAARAQYYGNDNDRGYGGDVIECKSSGYNYQRCPVPWRDARIVRQLSDTQCRRGQNWGFDRRGFVWVDRGCQARFVDSRGGGDGYPDQGGWRPGPGWNQRFSIRCESTDGQNRFCQVDVGGGGRVYLERQESRSPCYEGQTWGWNRGGVWVAQGCRGVFTIDRRW
jgi:hypothetical protein